jgi:hypothetical protein
MQWRMAAVAVVMLALAGCLPWQTYTSTDGAYSVDLPGKPRLQQHTLKKRFDKKEYATYTLNTAVVPLPEGAFLSAWADLPPGVRLDLNNQAQAIAGSYEGTVTATGPAPKLEGEPGVEFSLDTRRPPGKGVGRLWQYHNRLYLLLVLGPKVDTQSSEVSRFFGSFQLVDPLMQPEPAAH